MSLPFLNKKRISQIIHSKQKPSGEVESKMEVNSLSGEEASISAEIMEAIKADDKQMLWGALQAAFELMDADIEEGE